VVLDRKITMKSWHKMTEEEMSKHSDSMGNLVKLAIEDNSKFLEPLDVGFGRDRGASFTLWTEERVYFPAVYDGIIWVASVPRNPCDAVTEHIGGG
jgi:hypothetical protein